MGRGHHLSFLLLYRIRRCAFCRRRKWLQRMPKNKETFEYAVVIKTACLDESIEFYTMKTGVRLDMVFPADSPRVAVLSGNGIRIRLVLSNDEKPDLGIRIEGIGQENIVSPDGIKIEFTATEELPPGPKTKAEFVVHRASNDWITGRAGMKYRDLIPARLGGFLIGSQIHVAEAGAVPDYVHFHKITFQLIYCVNGWARLVYEDQGEPFRFEAGDCVLQPPGIRHRVLETSGNFDVIELSSPAEHETHIDHELTLPNQSLNTDRLFGEQRFVRSRLSEAEWVQDTRGDLNIRITKLAEASEGLIDVRVLRGTLENGGFLETPDSGFIFKHLINGNLFVSKDECASVEVKQGDTIIQPPGHVYQFTGVTPDLEILEVLVA